MKTIPIGTLVIRLGATIMLPVLLLVPLGAYIDSIYGTLPFVTIGALVLAACVSTVVVFHMLLD